MNNSTDFSLDISVNPGSSFKPLPDLVAFDLCKAYPASDGNLLLHNTRTGKRAMVMPAVSASLLNCAQFKPLDQHVENIITSNPDMQGQQADIRQVLKSMLDSGMMISAKQVCNDLKRKTDSNTVEEESSAPVIAILTWERPEALERLLKSIVSNCDTGQFHSLYVIDDSRKAENISQNQLLAEKFAAEIDAPLQYYGQQEQQTLLTELSNRLPEQEAAIRFLADQSKWIDHWTAGLSRNLALLLSCGHRLVMIDDDAVCDVYNPPQAKPNITFSDSPREADFFGSNQVWASQQQPLNPDPVNRHMQCLGLSLSQALEALGSNHLKPAGLINATALQTSELQADSQVLMTECGSLGCPGTTSNTWLPNMAPVSLKRMLASGEKTTQALTSRKVWSGRNQPHFAPRPNMSQITGFDNREMLPPYLPIMRGQDRLFGYMLDFIFPSAVTLDYPWAIPHLPIPDRDWKNKDLDFKPGDSFPMFFFEKILEHKSACRSAAPNDRLSTLSAWFKDMAAASDDELRIMYRDQRLLDDSEQLAQLTSLLSEGESSPVDWQNYLRNGISQLGADLDLASREDFPVRGLPASMDGDELIAFWKDVWMGFAAAMDAWPQIREAAAGIIATGVGANYKRA